MEQEKAPPEKSPMRVVMFVAAVLVCLSFWNAPQGEFVYDDDWQVVRNPLIRKSQLWTTALTSDVWAFKSATFQPTSNYYRPVFTAWCIGNYVLFELEPEGWHVANILLHLLAVWLALKVLVRLGFSWPVSAVAVWVFAAHPVHVESVTWVAGAPDLLMAVFLLWSLDAYLRLREKPTAKLWAVSLGAMLLAMGSKEASLMLAPAVVIIEFALSRFEGRPDAVMRALKNAAPFVLVAVAFFVLRASVLGSMSVGDQNPQPMSTVLLTVPQLVVFYLRQAYVPIEYSSAYPLRAVSGSGLGATTFWIPLFVTVLLCAAVVWMARKNARWAAAVAIALFILPAFYIRAFNAEHVVRDRYLYLPLLGLVVLLVDAVATWRQSESREFAWGGTAIGGLVVAAALGVLSMSYNNVWMDDVALWRRGVETDPNGAMANMQLAEALRADKRPHEAIPYAKRATELRPGAGRPYTVLGMCYKDMGQFLDAEAALKTAISKRKDTRIAADQLAEMYFQAGRYADAVETFEGEISRNAAFEVVGKQNIATVYVVAGEREEALAALESIREKSKSHPDPISRKTLFLIGELYRELGRPDEARHAYEEYLAATEGWEDGETARMRSAAASALSGL